MSEKSNSILKNSIQSLSALVKADPVKAGTPLLLDLDAVYPDSDQPRKYFPEEGMNSLAASITEQGVIQPITVHPEDANGKYKIKYGERRWRASGIAQGVTTIPAFIDDTTDDYSQMIENIQREDLSAMEIAGWISAKLQNGEKGQDIAKRLGKHKTFVSLYKQIVDLPEAIMSLYSSGVTQSARALVDIKRAYEVNALETIKFCERVKLAGGITQSDLKEVNLIARPDLKDEKDQEEKGGLDDQGPAAKPRQKNLISIVRVKVGRSNQKGVLVINKPSDNEKVWVSVEGVESLYEASTLTITSVEIL
ncbi:MAG: ParB/RepB/Spo0J family partition protein [Gammaproteobacteria bacterium]|nr:ParB/RepB/Spo0J family partition protein [Gammaproteobacteria bacterium]MBL4729742.1 ParB/RepB/Spo0J family partition protein [Gammaproteobacteria bacterium]